MTPRPTEARSGRRRFVRHGVVVAFAGGLMSVAVPSSTVRAANPLAGPATRNFEREPLHRSSDSSGAVGQGGGSTANPAVNAVGDLSHVVLALAIVIGIIFGLRWVARRFALVPTVGRSSRGVRLLSRTVLSPKQQVMLLQVGRRVIVVGDGGAAGMRPLCEITDPDEVAALVGELKSTDGATAGPRSFGSLFRRAAEPFDGGDVEMPVLAKPPGAGTEVSSDVVGLLDKVRGLRQQFDR